ncbi:MAG: DUF393 domain-containing protein [Bryobacteraceae bacterium]|nr:DUF393 domain-containing protein [Bryobacteraceae bacterium]
MIWDDRCSFCGRSIRLLRNLDRSHRLQYVGSSDQAVLTKHGITRESAAEEIKFVDGRAVFGGYDAVARLVRYLPAGRLASALMSLPLVRFFGRRIYRYIAAHRSCAL